MKSTGSLLIGLLLLSFACTDRAETYDVTKAVDPFIGTGGHGHTFPGPTLPFGMVQVGPDTRLTGWDGCSGYHYSDSVLYGFSHTHLSGTGVSDYGDILLMPFTGETYYNNGADGQAGYKSRFSKTTELASPGYYSVLLEKDQIKAELTCTKRAAFHKYTYPAAAAKKLLLDLAHRDELIDHACQQTDAYHIEGYRFSKAWAQDQRVFFSIKCNQPIARFSSNPDSNIFALEFGAVDKAETQELLIHVGISFVDVAGARKNREAELRDWNFEKTRQAAREAWAKELSKIQVKSKDTDQLTVFYSALYHSMIAPNIYSDVDGRYRGTDFKIHQDQSSDQYTVFSLWDTYRAAHPLYTIIDKARTNAYINTFLNQYEQGGRLPMWELANNYTGCMIGYHAVPVIADAYMKGVQEYDTELALKAMMASATADRLGIQDYIKNGFVPADVEPESVSKTLEYAYDDWCIARMAEAMGDSMYKSYYLRAQQYKNVFDPKLGFMRARMDNRWHTPFDPAEVNYHYTEANAWQYSFYVPQDVNTWMEMLGGPEDLSQKLDALFSADQQTSGREQADITGLIGQYAHGNEPSHHIAYLYTFSGEPHKTQQMVRKIISEQYSAAPDGYSGNEDCGQMSAWLVLSSLGFYPLTPGSNMYIIGSPSIDEASIQLESGKTFNVIAKDNSAENVYIQSAYLNGEEFRQTYLMHEQIEAGGELVFEMGNKPSDFGQALADRPRQEITTRKLVAAPVICTDERTFYDEISVCLHTSSPNAKMYYSINGQEDVLYEKPFRIDETATLEARAEAEGMAASHRVSGHFYKRQQQFEIELQTDYALQYAAGGDKALIDGLGGGSDYRTGTWQGYEGVDLEAIVDMGAIQAIRQIQIGFLQDENSWVFMPTEVQFFTSNDGQQFKKIGSQTTEIHPKDQGSITFNFVQPASVSARYVKVIAKNRGVCPPYHKGAGGKSWIFADEIVIK